MKVVHVLKQIDIIDQDIKELRKLEKSLAKDKSFTTPIYMSIEKQINLMLGERIKLLELKIENPPEKYVEKIEGKKSEDDEDVEIMQSPTSSKPKKTSKPKKKAAAKKKIDLDDEIPMLTQDEIDAKFEKETKKKEKTKVVAKEKQNTAIIDDNSVKLLDIALEKGTLEKKDVEVEKEKKVRFFRENFPSD